MRTTFLLLANLLLAAAASAAEPNAATVRFYQGVTAYIANPQGEAFDVQLDVREWNLVENGPREVLLKIYDPDGAVVARQVIEDDGIVGEAFMPEAGGWDHEMWYYSLCYGRGSVPMLRWSSLSDPARLAALKKRTFDFRVPAGKKGVYRVLMMGSRDHVATMRLTPGLEFGLAGHPMWMHGHGQMFSRSYVYVPRGTIGLHLGFAEFDQPTTRKFTVTAPDGEVLWDGPATGGFQTQGVKFESPGKYDDQVLTVDVAEGAGDYMLHVQLSRDDVRRYRRRGGIPAIFAPSPAVAKSLQGGAIYHDGKVFWHGFQRRFHDWLKTVEPDDFIVRDAKGGEIKPSKGRKYGWGTPSVVYKGLPTHPGYVPLNGGHEAPPLSDDLMHHYQAHKQRNVLNLALRDLSEGLRMITVGDMPLIGGWTGNLGYVFGTYGWHYWRPAWRVIQQSEAPPEVKEIVREAIILCGDRLAFARGIERTNGNAFSHVPMALRYAAEATKDPMLTELASVYLERFASEGWGQGSGISKSGDSQEHFAHDFHYGTYISANYRAVVNDLGDERFRQIIDRIRELYSYLYCPDQAAYPWGSRTAQGASLGKGNWKGQPGEDFTVSVNDGDEWFAARRANYYALTFHGRLAPLWLNHYFGTRMGYGGGIMCQVSVPGKGTVIASSLSGKYGKGMQRRNWQNFHIHAIVGTLTDGRPLVTADSEHLNAKLDGNTVTGSGEVRDRPLHVTRSYAFEADRVECRVQLADTQFRAAYWGHGLPSSVAEAYEMIPYVSPRARKAKPTTVAVLGPGGEKTVAVGQELQPASGLVIDRGGYGVKIVFDQARPVKLGNTNTVLVQLVSEHAAAESIAFAYTLIPYTGEPAGSVAPAREKLELTKLPPLDGVAKVGPAVAQEKVHKIAVKGGQLVGLQVALAGDDLALAANVVDPRVDPQEVVWKGSCLEVFGSLPKTSKIGQVFLAPAQGERPATGYHQAGGKIVAEPKIRLRSTKTANGYRLEALIPLALLTLDGIKDIARLEFHITASAPAGGAEKVVRGTTFGSIHAYENNARYGVFHLRE